MKAIVLLSAAFTMACSASAPPASLGDTTREPSSRTADDSTLIVVLGETASTPDGKLRLTFVKLESDSRCPANAVCVWQGDAATRLRVQAGGNDVDTTLHTTLEPRLIEVGGILLSLLEVRPYPGTTDQPATPRIVVRVTR